MISKRCINSYCNGDITKIENYELAVNDETQTWDCHHKLETHFSDGSERPVNAQLSRDELKALDMYFDRPPEELIFLTSTDHIHIHKRGLKYSEEIRKKISEATKRQMTEEVRKKISEAGKGNKYALGHKRSEETKRKLSEAHKGKKLSDETKKKLSEANKGEKNKFYGRKHSEETKKKISETLKHNNHRGLYWYNNGKINVRRLECPDGFVPGRIYKLNK